MGRKRSRPRKKVERKEGKKGSRYAENKKAFDQTMRNYRKAADTVLKGGTEEAVESKSAILNFRCDVEKTIERYVKGVSVEEFFKTYVEGLGEEDYGSPVGLSDIEIEQYTQKRLGSVRHRAEQRLGKAFIQLKIWRPRSEGTEVRK